MNENLLVLLQQKENTFSKGRKLLAKYIAESYDKAAFMTAAKLGEIVGVSESTVVRFASELGFNGYPGLQEAMQLLVREKMSPDHTVEIATNDSDAVSSVFRSELENLRQTAVFLDKDVLYNVVRSIETSENIYIIGSKTNSLLAEYLGYHLQFVFGNVHILTDSGSAEMLGKLLCVSQKDVVIGVNFPQYSPSTEIAMQYCQKTGATVVGFTDNKKSSFTKFCDYVLFAKCDKNYFATSMVAPFGLMNAAISAIALSKEKVLSDKLNLLDSILETNNV